MFAFLSLVLASTTPVCPAIAHNEVIDQLISEKKLVCENSKWIYIEDGNKYTWVDEEDVD